MKKEQNSAASKERALMMTQMGGSVIGSVVEKGFDTVTDSGNTYASEGTGMEECTLSSKDKILTALEKYEHVKTTGSYLVDAHKNKKEASKRITAKKLETKEAFEDSKLFKKQQRGETLTTKEKESLKNAKKRMNNYNKGIKKEERAIAKGKNLSDYEKLAAKRRKKLEKLSDLEQMTNYGTGDGQGVGIEEKLQGKTAGTAAWAAKRAMGLGRDLEKASKSLLEEKKTKFSEDAPSQEKTASKRTEVKSKFTSKTSDKELTKEEKKRQQKKSLQKRRNKIIYKNDKLSGAADSAKGIAKSKGFKAAALGIVVVLLLLVGVVLVVMLLLAAMGGVSGEMHEYTSYQAEDETLLLSNKVVVDEEKADKNAIKNTETDHPTASDGLPFDEYQYALDGTLTTKDGLIAKIKHDGNLIASYLTAKYGDYTLDEAKKKELKKIYEEAFKLCQYEEIQARTATYTNPDTGTTYYWNGSSWQTDVCTYRYAIFHTDLTTKALNDVLMAHLATKEQKRFYELYKSTSGQKDYLFGGFKARDDIYRYQYDPEEYEAIYGEVDISFSDAEAQQIYNVAQTQLGRAYVWGGSNVSTGFDCSGYVYWVMNTSGAAKFPRSSANVILESYCDKISPSAAKPGDLVFFQGTYATIGASHVGIYLGNNQMIHCGDPIKITNITTNYWTTHFYTFGRIKAKFK